MLVATLCSVVEKYIMLKLSSAKVWLAIVSVLLANENCRSVVTGTDDLAPSKVSNVMYGYSSAVALIASGESSESDSINFFIILLVDICRLLSWVFAVCSVSHTFHHTVFDAVHLFDLFISQEPAVFVIILFANIEYILAAGKAFFHF